MSISMGPLLIHSSDVSSHVRDALRVAYESEPDLRVELLEEAAQLLYRETDLGCCDIRELVGLPSGSCR